MKIDYILKGVLSPRSVQGIRDAFNTADDP